VDVAGTPWAKYPGKGTEISWVASVDNVQLLITGSGTEDEFRILATAAQNAKPLPSS
jgi:ribosomal protein L16/L10AE